MYVCTIGYGFSLLMVGVQGTLRKATKDNLCSDVVLAVQFIARGILADEVRTYFCQS